MKQYIDYSQEKNGICVVLRKGETTEDLVKRFRKKFSKSGVIKEVRDNMYFEKPSIKKRKKRAQAILLMKQEEAKFTKGFKKRPYSKNQNERKEENNVDKSHKR